MTRLAVVIPDPFAPTVPVIVAEVAADGAVTLLPHGLTGSLGWLADEAAKQIADERPYHAPLFIGPQVCWLDEWGGRPRRRGV